MSSVAEAPRPPSPVTARAVAFVADHKPGAEALGTRLGDLVNEPDAFAMALQAGLVALADPEYLEGQKFVAPGLGPTHGVRWPLLAAVIRGFKGATRKDPPTPLLFLADRLYREPHLEVRWFAFALLERTLKADPDAHGSSSVAARAKPATGSQSIALHPYGVGIAAEPIAGQSSSNSSTRHPAGSVASSPRRSRR